MFDQFAVMDLLAPEERQARASARQYAEKALMPHIAGWWDAGELPVREVMRGLGAQGFLGPMTPPEYGGSGASSNLYGALMYELDRVDSGIRSAASVQGSLVMYPIHAYGSEEQRAQYLPGLASGELIGCFGLTEESGGSDPGAMRTRARRDGDDWVLDGTKMWITNSPLADLALVWARVEEGGEDTVRGFIVPTDTPGYSAPIIRRKMSMRASVTGEIVLDSCRVPAGAMLPGVRGLKGPLSCLTGARFGIGWGAMGALELMLTTALDYTGSRVTFGQPTASRQLVQDKLVKMATDHSAGLLLAWRLGVLKDAGQMDYAQVSVVKRNNVRRALEGARLARELLGGNGITTEYPVIRHLLNLETVDTYEGTHDIHTLIAGRGLTGQGAMG
ncbi:Glutaryl-CoA dehydrogenase [Deinococcus proteolyticus MRP]|uniref:glutaryl-CoA dehydrogenase (ETF) n=1 Tax=Deinococcus proteolyticus (strain ATCC 35074 / DSM 20540 / JCM 6276 / NBRC 101906 / NCIMB 13154 / VKM Ac-1939 / CCM 2703 / MRP) TaxID=693977 RepID=F0RJH7_DEIPM|nr:acyl-CoA dehydrogenase family protein [Deinococcus proteolyticus]ADY25518.1 Glutaryl-CoA dehydrogenase [Deinococcus proteolyticus MRP]